MLETSDGGLPGQQPQVQAAPSAWRRRTVLIAGITAVAAAVAAVVLWPGSQPQAYTTLPPPCTLVTAATVARYLPAAASTPVEPSEGGGCRWLSTTGPGGQRELTVMAAVFGSSSGVADAKRDFDANSHTALRTPDDKITFTVTRQSVSGLGDQAAAQIFQPGKNAIPRTPVIAVDVRSRNADVFVTLTINQAGSAPLPTGTQLLSDTIAIARDVLTVLVAPGT
jgi:hypothetical protein